MCHLQCVILGAVGETSLHRGALEFEIGVLVVEKDVFRRSLLNHIAFIYLIDKFMGEAMIK